MGDNVSEDPEVEEIIVVDADDLKYVHEVADGHGVSIRDVSLRGIEPVTSATLILFGTAFGVGTVTSLLDRRKGGQVIDL